MLPWHIPGWSWWKVWKWPEYVMKWVRGLYEIKEARSKALKADEEYKEVKYRNDATQRENAIEGVIRKIEELDRETKRTKGASVSITEVKPAPDENPEIVAEAWRRFTIRRSKRLAAGDPRWPLIAS